MVRIELLKSPGCAACMEAEAKVKRLLAWAKKSFSEVQVEEIDITEQPKVAAKYGLLGGPAIAINGKLEFRGVPKEKDFQKRMQILLNRSR
jgi:glutaredoxin